MKQIKMASAILMICMALASTAVDLAPAQETSRIPPQNAVKLSEIISKVEKRPGFQYIERIQWFNDAYIVTFYTAEKAKVEMHFDATTGQPK